MTEFRCFLSPSGALLRRQDPIWSAPFPVHRNTATDEPVEAFPSYGDYFTGVRAFLEKDAFRCLTDALYRKTKSTVCPQDLQAVSVYLEKHGEFYHPAKIALRVCGTEHLFVLNVAISHIGKRTIHREYALLKRLRDEFPWPYLPDAYCLDRVPIRNKHLEMMMFLGEWFDGYHEFHISGCGPGGETVIVLWDEENGRRELSQHRVLSLFRKAAQIMTCYYNFQSFEQVCGWHHAAGDFIIRLSGDHMDMRLISVRQYSSMIGNVHPTPESMIQAMLVFLLNLSLRMRVDRIDGTGDLTWADDRAVAGTVDGFFDGMSYKARIDSLSEPLIVLFKDCFKSCTPADLIEVAETLVGSYHPQAPETDLIRRHLKAHCYTLYDALKNRIY